ncbi:SulP family inorganic anion transporter [Acidomonas methanolica]|uniref:Transporter of sulfate n=1 Tax=Acidomonas methanolica NBRC 104435 TaxID=1231351 RepID=A0A023D4L6_ACIMT|nr:SulP family inorganic anion transporter [Acidomonas methanolica]MBU2653935.1 STAS domain-containing protein [Acidomonas methanolica]TCS30896.1 MFS superfamily sulfate permease-like transporter [Acidomonas methanolica]GAJ28695.1 transporter of sulfate [Acidomonas methanolica NBRC 104435]GBQ54651.1 sulfate permease [Acidomonas methanolica]GEK98307.1 SulP family inorganic anion transporter [Acidomonas methanolica NBRC 104435]
MTDTATPAGTPDSPRASWWRETLAGVSEASMNLPAVVGNSRIAAMPAVTGLYTALFPLVVFACVGSSRHLVVAADSATAAILASGLAPFAPPASAHYIELVAATTVMAAASLLIARLFRLGFLADFLSVTVLVGFLSGVGVQVAIAMLHDMLRLPQTSNASLSQLRDALMHAPQAHGPSAALAGGTVVLLLLAGRYAPRVPAGLLLVIGGIVAEAQFGLSARGIETIGPVAGGLPRPVLPLVSWKDALAIAPVAASCVFVVIAQSAATARAYAQRFHETLDEDADLLGLACANAAAAFSGAFIVNGSPTKTSVALRAGARSQRAQIVFALVTALVLLFATAPLHFIPRAVLAGIVFVIGLDMIDLRSLLAIRRESPGECALALVTAAVVVGVGVQQGVLVAIMLSLFRHVRHSYRPHTAVLVPRGPHLGYEAMNCRPGTDTAPGLIIYRFGADLFYANCDRFEADLTSLIASAPHPVRAVVVDASAITDLDYSAAVMLRELVSRLRDNGIVLYFGRVSVWLRADMQRHRILPVLGDESLYDALHVAIAAAETSLRSRT